MICDFVIFFYVLYVDGIIMDPSPKITMHGSYLVLGSGAFLVISH